MPVAAAKAEGEVHLQVDSPGSVGASLVRADGAGKTVAVRSVDLAALLHRVLRPHTGGVLDHARAFLHSSRAPLVPLSLLKLDVEAFEYSLLPWLLLSGALCDVTHFLVEWHLNLRPLGQRLKALALRLSLHSLLEDGCAVPPRALYHEEYPPTNFAVPIPGLHDVLAEHSLWAGKDVAGGVRPSAPTVTRLRADQKLLNHTREQAAASDGDPSCAYGGGAVRCLGWCRHEQLACNASRAAASYEDALRRPRLVPRYFDENEMLHETSRRRV